MTGLPDYTSLKTKQRALRDGFHENLSLRVHRALSWLDRAEQCGDDNDARFIFLWIAFNAAYAEDLGEATPNAARSLFRDYFGKLVPLDTEKRIYNALWHRFSGPIRLLLDNKFVYHRFWNHQNQLFGYDDWEQKFAAARQQAQQALAQQNTLAVLTTLFDRLYVLRNQLMHGGATWNSTVNRSQVRDGAAILTFLIPLFIDLMMNHPALPWGRAHYPVIL
ncbi:HEPN domain-containing protein [Acidocella aromatica]|uniref:Apea-like HEPN domain-containing protein n=1 Tax=Acidocella aromatica TaxID=1303579 RepID=A0A840VHS1_9PROT|nr:HEPN domain-containing protein [Acidocella aromatica]MBB5374457.1 hypothetical protein [Acidocella aromatica]